MNLEAATVSNIPWGEARRNYEDYKRLVLERRATPDDQTLMRTYRRIAQGKVVIDIHQALVAGGLNEQRLPKLAVARADWPFVHAWWGNKGDGLKCYFTVAPKKWGRASGYQMGHNIGMRCPWVDDVSGILNVSGKAQVPMVPARFRPKGPLSAYRILFEAEWQRVPPVDPVLLRHVDGPFYVVLAAWDLTALERAVLGAHL